MVWRPKPPVHSVPIEVVSTGTLEFDVARPIGRRRGRCLPQGGIEPNPKASLFEADDLDGDVEISSIGENSFHRYHFLEGF